MVDFVVRSATRQQFSEIRALIHGVNINPTGLDWRRFLVAVTSDNALLGCGQIKPHFDGSRELASIAVKEHVRGQGVARAIIQELLNRETTRPLYLMCRARLEPLYVKFGFCAINQAEMPRYFQQISRAERVFNSKAPAEDRLMVMRLERTAEFMPGID
ncbi:MAG: GNAT family N-acetyltransferase [Anaerolineales bacterium]|jgi:N-acetylglutamate synthase-like GNAT family acetyltransferase